jgi:hypothetical protein
MVEIFQKRVDLAALGLDDARQFGALGDELGNDDGICN